jgi:hypothetical protein
VPVFCFPCRFFGSITGHSQEICFTSKGFNNWKRCDRILDHAKCKYHIVVAWIANQTTALTGNVVEMQLGHHAQLVRENRQYIKLLARIALFCGRQNIAMRGHDESDASCNKGNFLEFVDLIGHESPDFKQTHDKMSANAKYLSSDSQNALIESAARCITCSALALSTVLRTTSLSYGNIPFSGTHPTKTP